MYLPLAYKSFLSVRLSNNLWESDVWLFLDFINLVSIPFYNFIESIRLLYNFFSNFFFSIQKNIWSDELDSVSF